MADIEESLPTKPEPVVTSEAEDAPRAKVEGETAWYKVHHSMHGFLGFPHGIYSAIAIILSVAALVMSTMAAWSCEFFEKYEDMDGKVYRMGLFRGEFPGSDGCEKWEDHPMNVNLDNNWQGARASAIITSGIGIFAVIVMMFSSTFAFKKGFLLFIAFWFTLFVLLDALTFNLVDADICDSAQNSDFFEICDDIGPGAKMMIAAIIFWFFAAVSILFIPRYEPE